MYSAEHCSMEQHGAWRRCDGLRLEVTGYGGRNYLSSYGGGGTLRLSILYVETLVTWRRQFMLVMAGMVAEQEENADRLLGSNWVEETRCYEQQHARAIAV